MVTYTLTTPVSAGTISKPVTIKSLQVTSIWWTSTPVLAPIGAQEMKITLTDPASGWQEIVAYKDATVAPMWTASVTATAESLADVVATAVLNKLIADKKLPSGTISTSPATTPVISPATMAPAATTAATTAKNS